MSNVSSIVLRRPVLSYFVLAYAITYAVDIVAIKTVPMLFLFGTFGPLISAVVVTHLEYGWPGVWELLGRVRRWRVNIGWYLFVLFGFGALYGAAIGLTVLLGGDVDFRKVDPWYTVPALFILVLVVGGPLGEEFGWRGFALPRLMKRRGALSASVLLGLVWAFWHLPNWWIPNTEQYKNVHGNGNYAFFIGEFVVFVVGLSILMTFVYNGTGASMLMPLLLHSSVNTWDGWLSRAIDPAARPTFFVCEIVLLWAAAITISIVTGPQRLSRAAPNSA